MEDASLCRATAVVQWFAGDDAKGVYGNKRYDDKDLAQ